MLVEFKAVTQEPGRRRRWFQDDGLELIVWYGGAGEPDGFQICYVEQGRERALTWRAGRGVTHARVDAGDTRPDKNLTPVLAPAGPVPWARLRERFAECGAALPNDLHGFVRERLEAGA